MSAIVDTKALAERIRSEAAISSRPGQMARLEAIADEVAELPDIRVEVTERLDQPTTCKVWRGDFLMFDGRTHA